MPQDEGVIVLRLDADHGAWDDVEASRVLRELLALATLSRAGSLSDLTPQQAGQVVAGAIVELRRTCATMAALGDCVARSADRLISPPPWRRDGDYRA